MFTFLEGGCLALLGVGDGNVHHRHRFRLQCLAVVSSFYVGKHHLQRNGVANDVVDVEQEIEMLSIFQQSDMKEPVVDNVEGDDERL